MTQGFVNPYTYAVSAPTVTTYTSGSGTYTVPSGVQYINVIMVGGGGGGGGSGNNNNGTTGGTGGTSTFGSSLLTCTGGVGGAGTTGTSGGAGGTFTLNSPAIGFGCIGSTGNASLEGEGVLTTFLFTGGAGGQSAFFGGNAGATALGNVVGISAAANSGSGGAGASNPGGANSQTGRGGGAGACINAFITSPSSTYSYSVGAAGTAGTAGPGGQAGGAGGSGIIIIYEYYQTLGIPTALTLPLSVSNGGTGTSVAPSTFYVNTANTTVNGLSVVKYSNVINDSASAYSTSTGLYTIPRTGWYIVNANIKFTNYNYGAGAITQMNIYQNSTVIASTLTTPTAYNSTAPALNAGTVYYFTAGDTVSVQGFGNIGGGTTTLDNSVTNFLSINYLHA